MEKLSTMETSMKALTGNPGAVVKGKATNLGLCETAVNQHSHVITQYREQMFPTSLDI